MNFIIILLITALLQIFLPWWVIAVVPFLIHIWRPTAAFNAFWISFLAVGALWLGYGYYLHVVSNGGISDRIAQIFFLPNGVLLLFISALIGGLMAGSAGLSGFLVRHIFNQEQRN